MERKAYIKKCENQLCLDYYVDHENESVCVGSFYADKIEIDRNSDNEDDTSGFVILYICDEDMVFIADKIFGIEYLTPESEETE